MPDLVEEMNETDFKALREKNVENLREAIGESNQITTLKQALNSALEQSNAMQITITNLIKEKMEREFTITQLNAQCALMRDIIQEALSK